MNETERGELAARIAEASGGVIAQVTKNEAFVLPLTSIIATAYN